MAARQSEGIGEREREMERERDGVWLRRNDLVSTTSGPRAEVAIFVEESATPKSLFSKISILASVKQHIPGMHPKRRRFRRLSPPKTPLF